MSHCQALSPAQRQAERPWVLVATAFFLGKYVIAVPLFVAFFCEAVPPGYGVCGIFAAFIVGNQGFAFCMRRTERASAAVPPPQEKSPN